MTFEHYLIAKLADAMHYYGGTPAQRRAIGCMIRNRVFKFSSSWHAELHAIDAGGLENPHDPRFQQTLWDAEEIFFNRMADMTDGATGHGNRGKVPHVIVDGMHFHLSPGQQTPPAPIPSGQLDLYCEDSN